MLKNINLSLGSSEVVALVGFNGSGKSTLAKLALGLYAPTTGSMSVHGVDTLSISREAYLKAFSVVFQDFVRYEFSIRDNVGFGDISQLDNDKAIFVAMEKGDSTNIINQNMSLDSMLGRSLDPEGTDLSGGQWQRIAISRGFMNDSLCIVFDEPTSALDPLAELNYFTKLKEFIAGRSAIIISHRIGICKLADRVLFLDSGSITENGTHDELLALEGQYKSFYLEQAKWYDWSEL